jgi:hypothetical protein
LVLDILDFSVLHSLTFKYLFGGKLTIDEEVIDFSK